MDEKVLGALLAALLAASVFCGAYFFSQLGISIEGFLTIKSIEIARQILTMNFALFILLSSLTIAVILVISRRFSFEEAMPLSLAGLVVGLAPSLVLFPSIREFFVPIICLFVSVPFASKYLSEKEEELKFLPKLRSAELASGKIVLFICVGFLIYLFVVANANKNELEKSFIPEMMQITIGDSISLGDQFSNQLAGAIAVQQVKTVEAIQQFPEVGRLSNGSNPDGTALSTKLNALKSTFSSEGFKENLAKQFAAQKISVGEEVLKQIPAVSTIAANAWILFPVAAFFFVLFIGNILVKNLASLFYSAIIKLLPKQSAAQNNKK